jgi:hypothetical protein
MMTKKWSIRKSLRPLDWQRIKLYSKYMGFDCLICGKAAVARRLCRRHYQAWWKSTPRDTRSPPSNLKFKTIEERFWEKIDRRGPDECWPWKASKARGYGEFYVSPERGKVMAHVFAVELATGEQIQPGMDGCHTCDNPPCCNPSHVYYGTRKQNVSDMFARGRDNILRGEQGVWAKLTEIQVSEIRRRYAAGGISQRQLAEEFNVHKSTICHILTDRSWKHLT